MDRIKLAVLLSGGGTTLQNLIDRIANGKLSAEICQTISNRSNAYGIQRAKDAGIATSVVERKAFSDRSAFSHAIFDLCRKSQADLVCLAGFLQLIEIPEDFTNRVMNIHPALIPAFCGKGFHGRHAHEAVRESGVKVTGCTVHFADNQYDTGPIILQKVVPVLDEDDADAIAARVFEQECVAYPEAIELFAQGRLEVRGRRVIVHQK